MIWCGPNSSEVIVYYYIIWGGQDNITSTIRSHFVSQLVEHKDRTVVEPTGPVLCSHHCWCPTSTHNPTCLHQKDWDLKETRKNRWSLSIQVSYIMPIYPKGFSFHLLHLGTWSQRNRLLAANSVQKVTSYGRWNGRWISENKRKNRDELSARAIPPMCHLFRWFCQPHHRPFRTKDANKMKPNFTTNMCIGPKYFELQLD